MQAVYNNDLYKYVVVCLSFSDSLFDHIKSKSTSGAINEDLDWFVRPLLWVLLYLN